MFLEPAFNACEEPAAVREAALVEQLGQFVRAARGAFSANTERALRSDLAIYAGWCAERGERPLPATPATIAAFVDAQGGDARAGDGAPLRHQPRDRQPARIVPIEDDRFMPVLERPERLAANPSSALTIPAERIAPPSGRPRGGAAGIRLRANRRTRRKFFPVLPRLGTRDSDGGLRRRIRVSNSRHWKIQLAPGGRVPT